MPCGGGGRGWGCWGKASGDGAQPSPALRAALLHLVPREGRAWQRHRSHRRRAGKAPATAPLLAERRRFGVFWKVFERQQ